MLIVTLIITAIMHICKLLIVWVYVVDDAFGFPLLAYLLTYVWRASIDLQQGETATHGKIDGFRPTEPGTVPADCRQTPISGRSGTAAGKNLS